MHATVYCLSLHLIKADVIKLQVKTIRSNNTVQQHPLEVLARTVPVGLSSESKIIPLSSHPKTGIENLPRYSRPQDAQTLLNKSQGFAQAGSVPGRKCDNIIIRFNYAYDFASISEVIYRLIQFETSSSVWPVANGQMQIT